MQRQWILIIWASMLINIPAFSQMRPEIEEEEQEEEEMAARSSKNNHNHLKRLNTSHARAVPEKVALHTLPE
jgi:hypothetical protein